MPDGTETVAELIADIQLKLSIDISPELSSLKAKEALNDIEAELLPAILKKHQERIQTKVDSIISTLKAAFAKENTGSEP